MKRVCRPADPGSRAGVIAATSGLNMLVNVLIAAVKVAIGLLASSVAIVSEGINNAADALTSVMTLVGTKLAARRPDKKHPFGYGRVEYLTGLAVALLIVFTGGKMLAESVGRIFHPEALKISGLSAAVIAVAAVIKLFLGIHTVRVGRRVDSQALTAVGIECRNDVAVSAVTLLSTAVFLLFGLSVDAYAGGFTALVILKAGFGTLRETVSALIGGSGDAALTAQLYREIRAADGVLDAVGMMLHSYGPDACFGTVEVGIDRTRSVGEVSGSLQALQQRILQKYRVWMVFGLCADYPEQKLPAESEFV